MCFTACSIMKAGSDDENKKRAHGKMLLQERQILLRRGRRQRAVTGARSKLLIASLVLRPAANVDVTGTTNVAIARQRASTVNDVEFKSFEN